MYHGRFNSTKFNTTEYADQIAIRDIYSENLNLSLIGLWIFVQLATLKRMRSGFNLGRINQDPFDRLREGSDIYREFCAWMRTGQDLNRMQEEVGTGWETTGAFGAYVGMPLVVYHFEENQAGEIEASDITLLPTAPIGTYKRRRGGFNLGAFDRIRFDRVKRAQPVYHPVVTWLNWCQQAGRMQEEIGAGWDSLNAVSADIKMPLAVYHFIENDGELLNASDPVLLPTVPIGTLKYRRGGFNLGRTNHDPFDRLQINGFTYRKVTVWTGVQQYLGHIQNEIRAADDAAAQLNADICQILAKYHTGDNQKITLEASAPVLFPTVPLGPTETLEEFFQKAGIKIVRGGSAKDTERIYGILSATGFRVAYNHRISRPETPYIVYMRDSSPNFMADNRVYKRINRWLVILCTEKKSTAAERKLEGTLDLFDVAYIVADEQYDTNERIYQVAYEFEEIEDIKNG